jgi:hypothetical protein
MGLLSSLAKIGLGVAAPFTGGASLAAMPATGLLDKIGGAAGAAGTVMGGQQSGANNARVAQGQLDLSKDRNAIDLYGSQQAAQNQAANTDLQRQSFGTANRSATAKQALIGALLGGGSKPGGLGAMLNGSPDAMAAMKMLGSQGSEAQQTPLSFKGGEQIAAPTLTQMPKIDIGDSGSGKLSKILQIIGAVEPYISAGMGGGK